MTRRLVSDRTFRSWVARCRQLFPIDRIVRVRRCKLSRRTGFVGWCVVDDTAAVIGIDDGLDRHATVDTLLHEWTHALRHEDDPGAELHHDNEFWILFGSLYRTFHATR